MRLQIYLYSVLTHFDIRAQTLFFSWLLFQCSLSRCVVIGQFLLQLLQRVWNVSKRLLHFSSLFHFHVCLSLSSYLCLPLHHLLLHLKLFLCTLSSFSASLHYFSLPYFSLFPLHVLPVALPLFVFLFLTIFPCLCSSLSPSPVCLHPTITFPSPSHRSIRSWRSVSVIITMQSYSLLERLIARASRRLNSSQNKSCKPSALNWRMRAKPCWVSCVCVCVCVFGDMH